MEPTELPDELANIRHISTYKTPPDYFTNLADEIIGKVNLPLGANMPFSAPSPNYFANLADAILSKIKTEHAILKSDIQKELHQIEPLLTQISKTNVYRVPQGYFENFTVSVPAIKKPGRLVKMRRSAKWFSSAAAAVITGVIAVSIIFSVRDNSNTGVNGSNDSQVLSTLSDSEISNYLLTTAPEPDVTLPSQDGNNAADDGKFKTLLDNVSDNEIQNYLIENEDLR